MAWNPSPDSGVVGYFIRYGFSSDTCTNELDAGGMTNATVNGLVAGVTYHFSVTAYDSNGLESSPSNEIVYTAQAAPTAPVTLQMRNDGTAGVTLAFEAPTAGSYQIQATQDFQSWTTIWNTNSNGGAIVFPITDTSSSPHRFYRMVKN